MHKLRRRKKKNVYLFEVDKQDLLMATVIHVNMFCILSVRLMCVYLWLPWQQTEKWNELHCITANSKYDMDIIEYAMRKKTQKKRHIGFVQIVIQKRNIFFLMFFFIAVLAIYSVTITNTGKYQHYYFCLIIPCIEEERLYRATCWLRYTRPSE